MDGVDGGAAMSSDATCFNYRQAHKLAPEQVLRVSQSPSLPSSFLLR